MGGYLKEPNLLHEAARGLLGAGMAYEQRDIPGLLTVGTTLIKQLTATEEKRKQYRKTKTSPADVVQLSGCKDYQNSADTMEGVFSLFFLVTC